MPAQYASIRLIDRIFTRLGMCLRAQADHSVAKMESRRCSGWANEHATRALSKLKPQNKPLPPKRDLQSGLGVVAD